MTQPHTTNQQLGFTLIELLLYIALVSIFISGAILFGWDLVYAQAKAGVERDLQQETRLVANRVTHEVRNASALNSVSATALCLASATAARNPTRIYLASNRIRVAWGGGSSDCTNMTNDQPLTAARFVASSLLFTDLSSLPLSKNLQFSLTLESQGDRKEWQATRSITSSVEMRQP